MSQIDWSRLRSLTARELIAALIRDGFELRHQAGSHRRSATSTGAASPYPAIA
jgi:predicted RNA binding protein YcfA (HicA-like mRNA interferase family)